MAAAVFEMGEDESEVAALQWLEKLPAPDIYASDAIARSLVKYYVPVNDKMTVSTSVLQSTPGLTRSKQERSYPTSIPLDTKVAYVWQNVNVTESCLKSLCTICSNVIRMGHSSSFVRASAASFDDYPHRNSSEKIRWEPVSKSSDIRVRIAGEGEFERLKAACNADRIDAFVELKLKIELTKGQAQKEAKELFQKLFGQPYGKNLRAPEPTPANLGLWQGYRRSEPDDSGSQIFCGQHFDSELLVLTKIEGRNLGVQEALALTSRLRNAAMSHCPVTPTPAWLGGHDATTGKPTELPHAAFLVLPFVGRDYADGHVMGLAIALPNCDVVAHAERGRLLGPLFCDENGESRDIELKLGSRGIWKLRLEERPEPPLTLQNRSWVGPSKTWASISPVVLDRFPKNSVGEDRRAWEAEVCETIATSCSRAGLPSPVEIDLETTSWHIGAPRAYCKSRPLRSHSLTDETGTLGDGFPTMQGRQGKPSRPQIHVFLRFEQPVLGPVLIGAGRFLGYGLCKPIRMERKKK